MHDRLPTVLSAGDAALDAAAFDWYPVTKAVGNAAHDGPELAQPIALDDAE
ncbi:MAG TPA: hypothetical protein VIT92_06505 [Burkholderiaceae bacterium]